jgi:hypothetical protein
LGLSPNSDHPYSPSLSSLRGGSSSPLRGRCSREIFPASGWLGVFKASRHF